MSLDRRGRSLLLASFGALSEPRFRKLFIARTTSAIGDRMVPVALAFAALEAGGSATDLGLVLAAGVVPHVAFVLVGGVAGDRWSRGRIMVASDLVRAAAQGFLAVVLLTGHARIAYLVAGAAVWGAAAAFFSPASTGIVPATVSGERLQQANALMGLSRNVVGLAAPGAAGVVVATAGAGVVFAVDAATFLVSALFLVRLRLAPEPPRERTSFAAELAGGWRELTSRTWLWASILASSVWNLALAAFFVLGPVVASEELGGARAWGLVMTGPAVGAIVGGAVALRWKPARPLVAVFVPLLLGSVQVLVLIPPAPVLAITAAVGAAVAGVTVAMAVWTTTLQQYVPARALSRVSAYDWLGSLITMPLGYLLVGPAAAVAGVDATLAAAALLMAVSGAGALVVPSVRRLGADSEAVAPRTESVKAPVEA